MRVFQKFYIYRGDQIRVRQTLIRKMKNCFEVLPAMKCVGVCAGQKLSADFYQSIKPKLLKSNSDRNLFESKNVQILYY